MLYTNDSPGVHPASWYAASTPPLEPFDPLQGSVTADVAVVGAGYTGLSAALHLAQAGRDVVLLDAHRVGFGASGRNGGQLGSGQRRDQQELERMVGHDAARKLWHLGQDAKALVASLVTEHGIDCHLKLGLAWAASSDAETRALRDYAAHMNKAYDYPLEALDAAGLSALCPSPSYRGGLFDPEAGHLHPLAFALGLGRAAASTGVRIFERSEVTSLETGLRMRLKTAHGEVQADHVVLATNGYSQDLSPNVAARVMPINNFIAATEPLGARAHEVLTQDIAVADDRFVVNYFRLSHDGRLLFGGGESYGQRFPRDIDATVRKPLSQIFPHLSDTAFDYVWGGTLGITMNRLPYVARVAPNVLSASGYSGHGVGMATLSGKLMAQAIIGDGDGFDTLSRVPTPRFPGGARARTPLLALAMTWYALRDRLGL